MMETLYDPLDSFFTTETKSPISNDFLYTEQPNFDEFNFDPTAELPNNPELNFDMDLFQSFLDNLMSTETSSSFDSPIQVETEPTTREIGTDPMVEVSPPIIETTKLLQSVPTKTLNQFLKSPIIIIHTGNKLVPQAIENPVATIEYPMENSGTMTPSPSNHSTDDASPSSPEITLNYQSNNMITNLLTLPKSGPLILTNEELKLYKQEGYSIPTKLPLNKNDEKTLKRIQRKIKNKISAQDSRRKKKEYVETLEKQMERIVDENNALKERIANIEKSHRNLAQERDTLRSLMTNGNPGQSTVLMALVLFFAVLFGVWSPITMKTNVDDRNLSRDLALVPSNSFLSQNENTRANPLPESYKSRVLLSIDDHDHQHGPLLPTIQKSKYSSAAPGYTHSKTVERYMNKKLRSIEQDDDNDDENVVKKTRFDYERQEKVVIFEEPIEQFERNSNENKSVKIIRVERTKPAVGNDTLKLAQRIVHH